MRRIHAAVVVHHHGLAVCAVVEVDVDVVRSVGKMNDAFNTIQDLENTCCDYHI